MKGMFSRTTIGAVAIISNESFKESWRTILDHVYHIINPPERRYTRF